MGWFDSGESESRWSTQIEEFEYDVDAAIDLAKDTLSEIERLKDSVKRLRDVAGRHDESVMDTLADKFDSIVRQDIEGTVRSLRQALDAAQHLGYVVDSM